MTNLPSEYESPLCAVSSGGGAAWLALLVAACGTNAPEIPSELLEPQACNCPAAGYPQGDTGTEEGELLADAEFSGFRDPTGATEATPLETLRFSDYFDPNGELGYDLLLINTAAVWCAVCQEAHGELPELYATYRQQGLVMLGLLFQDAAGDPATVRAHCARSGEVQKPAAGWVRHFFIVTQNGGKLSNGCA